MTENLLITGGVGFIGSHVTRDILTTNSLSGRRIVILDDLSGGFRENITNDLRMQFIEDSAISRILSRRLFVENRFSPPYGLAARVAENLRRT
jgi:UDP-glucose 4-epimerase